ncbi:VOC family protein [Rhodococcus sp. 1168]|uniref:VOC family protein n=1 Tax=Rhodococcus sp. 1168 TaxID=2018041 RepID=UPI000A09E9E7|nr:glyoxalase [Rhodococcus sp. 1168]ORI20646.1 glyoxalase [Rhodococcus sp. 1168]
MPAKISVSFPTADLERSKTFYTAIGATIDPLLTDSKVACLVWDHDLQFMLLNREFFAEFTDKPVADPAKSAQVQIALALDSRDAVDTVVQAGLRAGGSEPRPAQDHGFMYDRDLEDPDGNNLAFVSVALPAVEQDLSDTVTAT